MSLNISHFISFSPDVVKPLCLHFLFKNNNNLSHTYVELHDEGVLEHFDLYDPQSSAPVLQLQVRARTICLIATAPRQRSHCIPNIPTKSLGRHDARDETTWQPFAVPCTYASFRPPILLASPRPAGHCGLWRPAIASVGKI